MSTKIIEKKSNRRENDDKIKKVADICDCSAKQVRNIRAGVSGNRRVTALGQRVRIAFMLLEEREAEMIKDIKITVNGYSHA